MDYRAAMTGSSPSNNQSTATSPSAATQTPPANLSNSIDSFHSNSSLPISLTVHKLNGSNYLEWAQTVKLAIDGRGKLGHLIGETRKPAAGDPNLKAWQSENSLLIAWLINSMEPAIGKPHLFLPTARDVWEAVRDMYSDVENSSQIFEITTQLWKSKQGERDVTTYYNALVTLWQELDLCYDDEWDCPTDSVRYKKRKENDRVYMFLAGLNEELDEVRGRILGRKPLPSIREVFSEVRREEARRKVMLKSIEPRTTLELEKSALISRGADNDGDKRKKPWCDYCKRPWHTKETYWKLHPEERNQKRRNNSEGKALQIMSDETQGQQVKLEMPTFTKEQLSQLYNLFQSPRFSVHSTSSCSLAQSGIDLGEDDWQC